MLVQQLVMLFIRAIKFLSCCKAFVQNKWRVRWNALWFVFQHFPRFYFNVLDLFDMYSFRREVITLFTMNDLTSLASYYCIMRLWLLIGIEKNERFNQKIAMKNALNYSGIGRRLNRAVSRDLNRSFPLLLARKENTFFNVIPAR